MTRPSRIASDLLRDREDPEAVAHIVVEAIRGIRDYPAKFVETLAPHARRFGLREGDGMGLLRWLVGLVGGDPDLRGWMHDAGGPRTEPSEAQVL